MAGKSETHVGCCPFLFLVQCSWIVCWWHECWWNNSSRKAALISLSGTPNKTGKFIILRHMTLVHQVDFHKKHSIHKRMKCVLGQNIYVVITAMAQFIMTIITWLVMVLETKGSLPCSSTTQEAMATVHPHSLRRSPPFSKIFTAQ